MHPDFNFEERRLDSSDYDSEDNFGDLPILDMTLFGSNPEDLDFSMFTAEYNRAIHSGGGDDALQGSGCDGGTLAERLTQMHARVYELEADAEKCSNNALESGQLATEARSRGESDAADKFRTEAKNYDVKGKDFKAQAMAKKHELLTLTDNDGHHRLNRALADQYTQQSLADQKFLMGADPAHNDYAAEAAADRVSALLNAHLITERDGGVSAERLARMHARVNVLEADAEKCTDKADRLRRSAAEAEHRGASDDGVTLRTEAGSNDEVARQCYAQAQAHREALLQLTSNDRHRVLHHTLTEENRLRQLAASQVEKGLPHTNTDRAHSEAHERADRYLAKEQAREQVNTPDVARGNLDHRTLIALEDRATHPGGGDDAGSGDEQAATVTGDDFRPQTTSPVSDHGLTASWEFITENDDADLLQLYQEKIDDHRRHADNYDREAISCERRAWENPIEAKIIRSEAANLRAFAGEQRILERETRNALYRHLESDQELILLQGQILARAYKSLTFKRLADAFAKAAQSEANPHERNLLLNRSRANASLAKDYQEMENFAQSMMQNRSRITLEERQREKPKSVNTIGRPGQLSSQVLPQFRKQELLQRRKRNNFSPESTGSGTSLSTPERQEVPLSAAGSDTVVYDYTSIQYQIRNLYQMNAQARQTADRIRATHQELQHGAAGAAADAAERVLNQLSECNQEMIAVIDRATSHLTDATDGMNSVESQVSNSFGDL